MALRAVSAAPYLAANIDVGVSVITGGTTQRALYDNGGVLGETAGLLTNGTFVTTLAVATASAIIWSTDATISRNNAGLLQVGTTAANALGSILFTNATASGKITANNYDCAGSTPPANGFTVPAANTVTIYTNTTAGLTVGPTQSVIVGNAALATAATDGFLYITTVASAPTGTPTAVTGRVPLLYDTANNQFWIYNGGWKQPKTPGAAATITWQ